MCKILFENIKILEQSYGGLNNCLFQNSRHDNSKINYAIWIILEYLNFSNFGFYNKRIIFNYLTLRWYTSRRVT